VKILDFLEINGCVPESQCSLVVIPLAVFAVSLLFSLTIVATTNFHGKITLDSADGIQKVHTVATPRVGGLSIYLAVIGCSLLLAGHSPQLAYLAIAVFPAFLAGFVEDITKRVSPGVRLAATTLSGIVAIALTGYSLSSIGIPQTDPLFSALWFSVIFTALSLAGVANAYNIIDGYNGLAGLSACLALFALGSIALQVDDFELAQLCLIFAAATLGFVCLNWPWGRLFLGDGGSYSLGFAVGWLAVMLVERNSEVSPFAGLLVCIHPVTEVIYSMVRRSFRKLSATSPDRLHMHSLLGRRYVNRWFSAQSPIKRNSLTGLLIAAMSLPSSVIVQFFFESTLVCIILCVFFVCFYLLTYRRMVRFSW